MAALAETMSRKDLKLLRGIPMRIDDQAFVAVPVGVLRTLLASLPEAGVPLEGLVEAGPFMRNLIAGDLRAARTRGGLTQSQLAIRMKVSQTRVSLAERGAEKVGLAFVKRWLHACGLPEDWKP